MKDQVSKPELATDNLESHEERIERFWTHHVGGDDFMVFTNLVRRELKAEISERASSTRWRS